MLYRTTTGYIKSPYNMGDCRMLEDYLSIYDNEKEQHIPYAYIVHDNTLYFPLIEIERFLKPLGESRITPLPPNQWKPMSAQHISKVPPRDALQENIIKFITAQKPWGINKGEHQIGIVAKPGKGKAQPISTKIPTPTDWSYLGDLKVGDLVFNWKGKPTKVLAVYDQGIQDVYELTFDDGRKARCSAEHLWSVGHFTPGGIQEEVLSVKDLMKDYVTRVKDESGEISPLYKYIIPIGHGVVHTKRPVPMDPYLFGYMLTAAHGHVRHLTISALNASIPLKIANLCGYRLTRSMNGNIYQFHHTNGRPVYSKEFFRGLPKCMLDYPAHRYIPPEYIYNAPEIQLAFLEGMVDGIHYIPDTKNDEITTVYCTTSELIAKQLQYMLWSIGMRTHYVWNGEVYFVNAIKDDDPNYFDSGLLIKDIQLVGKEDCRCILIDDPSHLYLTEDYIVTHNTFTSIYSISALNRKTLVITHMTKIKKQWMDSFIDKFDYTGDEMMELSSHSLDLAASGTDLGKDVYFINHQTINRWMANASPTAFNKALQTLGIGIKIIDEYHLHWRNSLIVDMFTNVDKTIYLTATFDRSNPEESSLFHRVTPYVKTYGTQGAKNSSEKHTIYHPILYTTKCPMKKVYRFGNGHGMGMKKWLYADWAHFDDPSNATNNLIFQLVKQCLEDEGRILITVASIKATEGLAAEIQKLYPDLIVGAISSNNKAETNERLKESADIIVSTIQSAGTGVDISNLRYIINAEPFSSKLTAEQFLGRLRPYYDSNGMQRDTHLFDLVDRSIIFCNVYYKGRSKRLTELAKEVQPLEMQ